MLKTYRPITNIPFLSKILEKVVAKQLTNHMSKYGLHDCFQSAYRPGHSTETVLLTVKDYMQSAFDNREGMLLVMLDMSAAFDTLNHAILLKHLETEKPCNPLKAPRNRSRTISYYIEMVYILPE